MPTLPFRNPGQIDAVVYRIITRNDDSGRHGVLMPREAYALFPSFGGFQTDVAANYTADITTVWPQFGNVERESKWKHYHRYPERRVTALRSRELDAAPAGTMIVFGRLGPASRRYEVLLLAPDSAAFDAVLERFGVEPGAAVPGNFGVDLAWSAGVGLAAVSPALTQFLRRFDEIARMGPIPTRRPGPTGVGHTLESLLGIVENNSPTGDFLGMEVKAFRSDGRCSGASGRHNLFLKEPRWRDGLSIADRIRAYGYVDGKGGHSLYVTVSARPNAQHLSLSHHASRGAVDIDRAGVAVGGWTTGSLRSRLDEKLRETVFVAATPSIVEGVEHFRYWGVTYCAAPSIDALAQLVGEGEVVVELRMRVGQAGGVRNHGTAFRVQVPSLPRLFARAVAVRQGGAGRTPRR